MKSKLFFFMIVCMMGLMTCGCFIERWFGNDDKDAAAGTNVTSSGYSISGVVNVPSAGALKAVYRAESGINVYLLRADATLLQKQQFSKDGSYVAKTVTNANGQYRFTELEPGSYLVFIDANNDNIVDSTLEATTAAQNIEGVLEDVFIRNYSTLAAGDYILVKCDKKEYSNGNTITVTVSGNLAADRDLYIEVWNENDSETLLSQTATQNTAKDGNNDFSKTFTTTVGADWPGTFSATRPVYRVYVCTGIVAKSMKMSFLPAGYKRIASTSFILTSTISVVPDFIMYVSGSGISKMGLDGSNSTSVRLNASNPMLSSDLSRVIFANALGFYSMFPSGANEVNFGVGHPGSFGLWISEDGSKAVYSSAGDIFSRNTATGALTEIANTADTLVYPTISSDGNTMAWIDTNGKIYLKKGTNAAVLLKDLLGSNFTRLCMAPDATSIVYQNGTDIYKISTDATATVTNLTDDTSESCSYPVFSPNSQKIAYFALVGPGSTSLYVKNADGTGKVCVATNVLEYQCSWTRDSSRLVYTKKIPDAKMAFDIPVVGNIRIVNADGSNDTALTATNMAKMPSASSMTISIQVL